MITDSRRASGTAPRPGARPRLFLGLLLLLLAAPLAAQEEGLCRIDAEGAARMDARVERFMKRFEVPGLSLAIAREGKMVVVKGYGFADREAKLRVAPRHRFRIASVSKPITAVTILRLVEAGKLGLDDRVCGKGALLGEGFGPVGPNEARVTVRHLLQHTAAPEWANARHDPMFLRPGLGHRDLIAWVLKERSIEDPPGTRYAYSNFGYCILGRVIEAVSGESYPEAVKHLVLSPCGIEGMEVAGDTESARKKDEVCYYAPTAKAPYRMKVARMDAHGGWIATPSDLVRFALHVDGFPEPRDILGNALRRAMTTTSEPNPRYALGWSVNAHDNWWHTGSLPGTASILVRTSHQFCWAVLVNTRSRDEHFTRELDALTWRILEGVKAWDR